MDDPKSQVIIDHAEHLKSGTAMAAKHQHAEGDALLVTADGEVRRLPVPSSNPNDPLNFRPWEKYFLIFCCCWFSIMGLSLASGLGAILSTFFAMYAPLGYDSNQIVFLITMPTLCIGLGNYIILPLSLAYGRRPVFLVSLIILLGATIGSALQQSYEGHLATRIIQGLATGASESLLPLMLTEVTFLHERGRIFGLYWMVQNVFGSTLNLTSSYINNSLGWRWYYWVFVITIAVGTLFAFLGAFETRFSRPATSLDGQIVVTDEFGVTQIIPDSEAQAYLDRLKQAGISLDEMDGTAIPRKSYMQKLQPWSEPHERPGHIILHTWLRMFESMTSPAIFYTVLISSITLGCGVAMSLTYEAVLVSYGWATENVGLINVGGVIGAALGMSYCVLFGDPLVIYLAKRNNGVHIPEHRLLVLIFPAVVGFSMLLLYGFTASGGSSWWGPYIGWTFFQGTFTAVLIISTTFASEASPKHPGPALVVVVGTKNIISFAVAYGLTPMTEEHGYKWAFGVLSSIFLGIFLLGIPVYFLNPVWRRYRARMEEKQGLTATD